MGEQDINALSRSIDSLIRVISNQTKELRQVMAPLEKLPEIAKESQRVTQNGLADLQRITVELRLREITGTFSAQEAALRAEEEALQGKTDELAGDVKRISTRYEETLERLNSEATSRVRALDAPVLNLLEQFFPETIRNRYAGRLLRGRRVVSETAGESLEGRKRALSAMLEAISARVAAFLNSRSAVERRVESHITPASVASGRHLRLPVFVFRRSGRTWFSTDPLGNRSSEDGADRELMNALDAATNDNRLTLSWEDDGDRRRLLQDAISKVGGASEDSVTRRTAEILADELAFGKLAIAVTQSRSTD